MAARKGPTPRERRISGALQPQGGLAQMMAQAGAPAKLQEQITEVESMPGGMELLYTHAAEELMQFQGVSKKDAKKIRLYSIGGAVERAYAKGGPARAAAEKTRQAGRGDDSMMLHVSPEEYEVIESMWGKADINPETGIGEYGFLSKIWKKIKKAVKSIVKSKIFQIVAPLALSIFVPGLGAAIGGALGAGTGATASIIGNALVQGGLSAAGGGDFVKGALTGAITGGLGKVAGAQVTKIAPGITGRTADIIGSSLAGGGAEALTGGDFVSGAVMGGLGEYMRPTMEGITERGREAFGLAEPQAGEILARRAGPTEAIVSGEAMYDPLTGAYVQPEDVTPAMLAANEAAVSGGPPGPGATVVDPTAPAPTEGGGLGRFAVPALMAAGMAGGAGAEYEEGQPPQLPPEFLESLPLYTMNRQFEGIDPSAYYTYGQAGTPQSGQHLFITPPDPFAGETGTPTVGPAGGLGGTGGIPAMIAANQVIPATMARGPGQGQLVQAGYTQDPNTGDWLPPQQALGQGLGRAHGGYQRGGEYDYWSQNADVPHVAPSVSASGRYVKGQGTGRSDDIPARLSDGEYVMDAETVALLGDGSGSAGARRLDEMRRNLRQHKAEKLKKGGFSHKAKAPHQYMARGGMAKLRRAMTEAGRI